MNQLKQETQKLNKLREGIQRKLRDVENHKLEVEQQRETLKSQVMAMERGRKNLSAFFLCSSFQLCDTRFHGYKYSSAKQTSATCQNAVKNTKYLVSYQQPLLFN